MVWILSDECIEKFLLERKDRKKNASCDSHPGNHVPIIQTFIKEALLSPPHKSVSRNVTLLVGLKYGI